MGVGTMGPITLKPGDINYFTVALVWSRAGSGSNTASLDLNLKAVDEVQSLFNNCFDKLTAISGPASKKDLKVFPNPFIHSTLFSFSNESRALVELKIFNSEGAVVKHVSTRDQEINLAGLEFKSGIYFYQLILPQQSYSGKLLLQ